MTFDELEHVRSQLYSCRSHEADLQLEVERLREEIARLQSLDEVASVAALAESMGWRLHHLLRRHHPDDGGDPPLWEATARNRSRPAEHEIGEGSTMAEALHDLDARLQRRRSTS